MSDLLNSISLTGIAASLAKAIDVPPPHEAQAPIEAISRLVENNTKRPDAQQKAAEQDDTHKGYVQIQVEVGMSNDAFVEILSGLSEGDEVLITTVASSDFFTQMMQGGGMPGGGMPGGGMPGGGGMPSGNRGGNMNAGPGGGMR